MRTSTGRAALTISSPPTPRPVQSWNIQPLFRICLRSSMATTENAPSVTCKLSTFSSSLTQGSFSSPQPHTWEGATGSLGALMGVPPPRPEHLPGAPSSRHPVGVLGCLVSAHGCRGNTRRRLREGRGRKVGTGEHAGGRGWCGTWHARNT